MKFLSLNNYKKLTQFSADLPVIVGTTVFSFLISQPALAFGIDFSFDPEADNSDPTVINDWNHGNPIGTTEGWTSGQSAGTATDPGTGISITFEGAPPSSTSDPYLSGTAVTRSGNFTFDNQNLTTSGLKIANRDDTDGNGLTLTIGTDSDTLSGGILQNYQLLTFEFSEPIIIDSSNPFFIDDIDDRRTNRNPFEEIYIDAVAVEGFTNSSIGERGTGLNPNFNFANGVDNNGNSEDSNLKIGSIDFDNDPNNENNVNYVYDGVNSSYNPKNRLQSRAYYDFGATPVQSVALYFFNGIDYVNPSNDPADLSGHAVTFGGTFSVREVPFEFSPGLGLLLSGIGLLRIRHLKREKFSK